MGLIIVAIVGAILGWLAAVVIERDDGMATLSSTLIGAISATASALAAGDVPLLSGVSPAQLLWAVIGTLVAIVVLNVAHSWWERSEQTHSLPTRRGSGVAAPVRR